VVTPYTNGFLTAPGTTDIGVQDRCAIDFADHLAVNFDRVALREVYSALDPANAQPASAHR
jgi:hypothetical protein